MTVLAVETSCDETSVAVVCGGEVRSNAVSSQIRLHAEYGGVVPELATRAHLQNLLPLARLALEQSGLAASDLEGVAATRGPGLPSALMVGWRFAQSLAFVWNKPCLPVHHHEAHLYSPWIAGDPPRADWDLFEPNVSLIVSGGHTMLVEVAAFGKHRVLGSTVDDAAGECFDKTAKLIGLPYPGGPVLDRLAEEGNPQAFSFPRPMLHEPHHDFSFSGLKTSVRYFLRDRPGLVEDPQALRDFCASVRAAIVEVLVRKTLRAARATGHACVTASGGVICNLALRRELEQACAQAGLGLRLAKPEFATDNAAMVGVLAERRLREAQGSPFPEQESDPGWSLDEVLT